jgi:hypothetical protein
MVGGSTGAAKRENLLGGGRLRSPLTEREGRPSLTRHPLPAAGGQAREGRPLRCISGQAAAARWVVVVDTPHWGAAAASPAGATAADSCSSQQEHASANSDGMSRMRRPAARARPGTGAPAIMATRRSVLASPARGVLGGTTSGATAPWVVRSSRRRSRRIGCISRRVQRSWCTVGVHGRWVANIPTLVPSAAASTRADGGGGDGTTEGSAGPANVSQSVAGGGAERRDESPAGPPARAKGDDSAEKTSAATYITAVGAGVNLALSGAKAAGECAGLTLP